MSDVFISYSRRDGQFVQRLNNALVEENRIVWVDWQGIPAGEDWWKEIESGIENAETFVAVISENWLASPICHQELDYAVNNNKRIIPLVHQRIDGEIEKRVKGDWMDKPYEQVARANWESLRNLNWIFVDSEEAFDTGFAKLLATIDEDQPHLKAHTRYLRRALEWKRSNENPSFLLLGDDLLFAEKWLTSAVEQGKTPHPTELQKRYIEHSRRLEDDEVQREATREKRLQQLRFASVILAIVGGIAVIATLIAIPTSINAQNSNSTSVAQISTADTILVTSTSVAQQVATGNADLENAILAQDEAQAQVTSIAEQVLTSDANLANAQEQVLIAGETLTPVASTLTAVADDLVGALNAQSEALIQVTTIAEQVATSDANLVEAVEAQDQAIAEVTTIARQVATSDASLALAVRAEGLARSRVQEADATLSPIPATLTAVATALQGANTARDFAFARVTTIAEDIATSDANLAVVLSTQDAALEQVAIAGETLTPVPPTLTAVAEVVQQTQNELDISNQSGRALQSVRNGYVGEALSIMNDVVEEYPEEVNAYLERAFIYRQIGQPENSYEDYTTAIELQPDRAETYNVRALVLQDLDRAEESLADFATAIELSPNNATYYGNRGSFYSRLGELDLALQDLNQAIELRPESANTYVTRAGVYIALDRIDDAIADYTTAIELEPTDANAYNSRASSYSQLGEDDLAIVDLNRAIELEPQQASYYNNRSFVLRRFGDDEAALADLNRAIELAPGNASYFNNRYFLHRELGNIENALADITRVMDANPSPNASDFLTRGLLYLDLEQYDGAIADFTRYIEFDPTDPGGYDLRGAAYTGAGRYNAALADYAYIMDELTAEGRMNLTAVINQGWTYYKMGDFERALENNNRALRAVPDEVFALGNRGLIYLVQGRLDLAFADYSMMADIQLNNPPRPDVNIFEPAIIDINDIIAEDPDNGSYYMMRGYLHYMNGNRILASVDWSQATQLGTQFLPEIDALRQ